MESHSEFSGCANDCNKFVSSRSWYNIKLRMTLLRKGASGALPSLHALFQPTTFDCDVHHCVEIATARGAKRFARSPSAANRVAYVITRCAAHERGTGASSVAAWADGDDGAASDVPEQSLSKLVKFTDHRAERSKPRCGVTSTASHLPRSLMACAIPTRADISSFLGGWGGESPTAYIFRIFKTGLRHFCKKLDIFNKHHGPKTCWKKHYRKRFL